MWVWYVLGCLIECGVGAVKAWRRGVCMLYTYSIIQLLFGIIIVVIGAFVVVYTGYQKDIAAAGVNLRGLDAGMADTKWYMSDWNLGVYTSCCMSSTTLPDACASTTSLTCYHTKSAVEAGMTAGATTAGDAGVCKTLKDFVGAAACPGNAATNAGIPLFNAGVYNYYDKYFWPAGVAFCVFGGILLLAFFGSCYVACTRKSKEEARYQNTGKPMV